MEHLLFAAYLVLFSWIVTRVKFFKNAGLTAPQLVIVFLIKIIAGIIYGWIGVYYGNLAQMVDTWAFHYEALKEYHVLKDNPGEFFSTIFSSGYEHGYEGFFSIRNSWWNDIKGHFFIKLIALFNVLSFGHYYTNVIIYSFISLFGCIGIYRIMKDVFPGEKLIVLLTTFLLPSFLYWTSGIHKDGLIFLAFSIISYQVYFSFKRNRFTWISILSILGSIILLLILRNFLIVVLLPALIAWCLAEFSRLKPIYSYLGIYSLFILLFFTVGLIVPGLDLPSIVIERQEAFIEHTGGSEVDVEKLKPTAISFLVNLPQAFSLSVLRPYPSDVRHLLSLAAASEIFILLVLFVVFLLIRKKGPGFTPFLLFCIFFSLSVLLMIGYTVNFLGAIVRYRSIVLPFLIIPMMVLIDWKRLGGYLIGDMNNKNNIHFFP